MKKYILAGVGRDQSGIVAAVTHVLYDTACNIEDTSMIQLEDYFTVLMFIQLPPNLQKEQLETTLKNTLAHYDLQLSLYETNPLSESVEPKGSPWLISVSGTDQTGIIMRVTAYLSKRGLNIRHLSSKRLLQKVSTPVFLMSLEVDVEEHLEEDTFLKELQTLAAEHRLEIHAEPLNVYTL